MILLALLLQTTPVQPIVKGTALPPPASEEGQVLAPVQRMFDALAAGDGAAFLAQVRSDGRATVAVERSDGTRAVTTRDWPAFAAQLKPGGPRAVERFTGQPAIEIDGDIAMVWGPYDVTVAGRLAHCGTDHFSLVRDAGSWKILNATWTQRTTGCVAP